MFAIAIWDGRKEQLVLARDRLGKKPLYYCHRPGQILFASELKSLTKIADLPRSLDLGAIDSFLTYQYVPHPSTIYEGVSKLEPGHFGVYRQGDGRLRISGRSTGRAKNRSRFPKLARSCASFSPIRFA